MPTGLDVIVIAVAATFTLYAGWVCVVVTRSRRNPIMVRRDVPVLIGMTVASLVHVWSTLISNEHAGASMQLVQVQSCVFWDFWLVYACGLGAWGALLCQRLLKVIYVFFGWTHVGWLPKSAQRTGWATFTGVLALFVGSCVAVSVIGVDVVLDAQGVPHCQASMAVYTIIMVLSFVTWTGLVVVVFRLRRHHLPMAYTPLRNSVIGCVLALCTNGLLVTFVDPGLTHGWSRAVFSIAIVCMHAWSSVYIVGVPSWKVARRDSAYAIKDEHFLDGLIAAASETDEIALINRGDGQTGGEEGDGRPSPRSSEQRRHHLPSTTSVQDMLNAHDVIADFVSFCKQYTNEGGGGDDDAFRTKKKKKRVTFRLEYLGAAINLYDALCCWRDQRPPSTERGTTTTTIRASTRETILRNLLRDITYSLSQEIAVQASNDSADERGFPWIDPYVLRVHVEEFDVDELDVLFEETRNNIIGVLNKDFGARYMACIHKRGFYNKAVADQMTQSYGQSLRESLAKAGLESDGWLTSHGARRVSSRDDTFVTIDHALNTS